MAHFDVQCLVLDQPTVEGITERPATHSIPEAQLPADHVRPNVIDTNDHRDPDAPIVEAGRGEPIADPSSSERRPDGTFITLPLWCAPDGDGGGHPVLFEPMTAVDFADQLDAVVDVELSTPEAHFTADEFPTSYAVRPDGDGGIYVYLDDFETVPGQSR